MNLHFVPTPSLLNSAQRFGQLQFDSWGHLYPDASPERSSSGLRTNSADTDGLGTLWLSWYALNDSETPLGVAMLVGTGEVEPANAIDLPGPWFAGLVVDPAHRSTGIGSALLEYVKTQAQLLGFNCLRLVTENETNFYERRGWRVEQMIFLNSVPNTVMICTLDT